MEVEEIEKVREWFSKDRYATETGAVIEEIGDHYARVSLILNEHHKNAVGGVINTLVVSNKTNAKAKEQGIAVELYLGNEIYITENIIKLLEEFKASTINNTSYVLFEMPLNVFII